MLETDSAYYPYRGLPCDIVESIVWKDNGNNNSNNDCTNIVIKYSDEKIVGYENVRYPTAYLKTLFKNKPIDSLESEVQLVYVKTNYKESKGYALIWDSSNKHREDDYPNEALNGYWDAGGMISNRFFDTLLSDIEFGRLFLSTYYPFSADELEEYWDYIALGDTFYSTYIHPNPNNPLLCSPKFGLSFNSQIEWTNELIAKYKKKHNYAAYRVSDNEFLFLSDKNNKFELPLSIEKERKNLDFYSNFLDENSKDRTLNHKFMKATKFINDTKSTSNSYDFITTLYSQNKIASFLNITLGEKSLNYWGRDKEFCKILFQKVKYLQDIKGYDFKEGEKEYRLSSLCELINTVPRFETSEMGSFGSFLESLIEHYANDKLEYITKYRKDDKEFYRISINIKNADDGLINILILLNKNKQLELGRYMGTQDYIIDLVENIRVTRKLNNKYPIQITLINTDYLPSEMIFRFL